MAFSVHLVKKANEDIPVSPRKELEGIMKTIYDESPWKWPYGLDINGHDEIFMIREASSNKPVGFTGWQERRDGMDKIGFYTIGVLPEFRGNGLAKEAVSKLILRKAAGVDKVRAVIADGNKESEHLANSLGVPFETLTKRASGKGYAVSSLLGGLGNSVFWDQVMHPEATIKDTLNPMSYDKSRAQMFGLNALLGGVGGAAIHGGSSLLRSANKEESKLAPALITGGIGTMVLSPTKDLMMKAMPLPDKIRESLTELDRKNMQPTEPGMSSGQKLGLGALLGLGVGAGAYGVNRLANAVSEQTANNQKARVKVTLPTKDPGDHETTIDAPISDFGFSARVYNDLGRDTRRKLRGELNERKHHRKPKAEQPALEKAAAAPATPKPQQAPVPQVRTPWAMNYSQQQMPAAPDQDLLKKVDDAHARIEELSNKLKEKNDAPKADVTSAGSFSPTAITSRINTAMRLIGAGTTKSAAVQPAPDKTKTSLTVGQLQYGHDLANRTFRGKPGIQTPISTYSVPFGAQAYRAGTLLRRAFMGSPQPSASAQFMEENPPQLSWQQQASQLAPYLVSQFVK